MHAAYEDDVRVADLVAWLRAHHRPPLTEEFAVWCVAGADGGAPKLRVLKDDVPLSLAEPYFVLYHSQLQALSKRVTRRVRKQLDTHLPRTAAGKPVYTSENSPLQVDYVPDAELYVSARGRLGLCMAPGRNKKKSEHVWARDLSADLERLRHVYGCDVLVTLLRPQEMLDMGVAHLCDEVQRRGMESIHFPIKDKWIPESMEQLVALVEAIIARLRRGLSVVAHCNGGKGRSGTVLVATLVGLGRGVQQAIDVVRHTRAGTIRNPLQIVYVKRFKHAWAKRRSAALPHSHTRSLSTSTSASSTTHADDADDGRSDDDHDELAALELSDARDRDRDKSAVPARTKSAEKPRANSASAKAPVRAPRARTHAAH